MAEGIPAGGASSTTVSPCESAGASFDPASAATAAGEVVSGSGLTSVAEGDAGAAYWLGSSSLSLSRAGLLASGCSVGPLGDEGSSRGRFCEGAVAGTGEVDMFGCESSVDNKYHATSELCENLVLYRSFYSCLLRTLGGVC